VSKTFIGIPVFAMSAQQSSKFLLRAALLGSALALAASPAVAQSSNDVTVDLSAIDGAPVQPPTGRIVLRPPSGTKAVSSSQGRTVKLRPPQAKAATKVAKAAEPEPRVESRAEPITPAPTPPPAKTAEAPKAPAPVTAPAETPVSTAPARPVTPPPTKTAEAPKAPAPSAPVSTPTSTPTTSAPTTSGGTPSAAAVKSAQQDQAGPAPFALPDKQQTAAVPPPSTQTQSAAEEMSTALSVPFAAGVTDIDVASQGSVKDLAKRMASDKSLRVQLMAYASDPDKNTSKARRLALDRAIAIRNLLIDGSVERTRIEVRALGDQGEGGNLDRVDAVIVKR
jgi:outer membrane protein OmpA-like peptidoglycan-associated protein